MVWHNYYVLGLSDKLNQKDQNLSIFKILYSFLKIKMMNVK